MTFHARHEGLLDPAAIEAKHVLLFGCGSIGSVLAMLLARAGVRSLTLVDHDLVTGSNICRTAFVERDVGRSKVEGLAGHLQSIRDGIAVEALATRTDAFDDDALIKMIERADLVVAATDEPRAQGRIATLSYHRTPTLFVGAYARGEGGEALFTLPGEPACPCYFCVIGAIRDGGPERGRTDYGSPTGRLMAEPALGVDVASVTTRAAQIALALLLRGSGFARLDALVDATRSILFVGNAATWIWGRPLLTYWGRAEKRIGCICALAPGASTAELVEPVEQP